MSPPVQELLEKRGDSEHLTDSLATEHSSRDGSRIQKGRCHVGITTLAVKGARRSKNRGCVLTRR